jgi:hypothetical protein
MAIFPVQKGPSLYKEAGISIYLSGTVKYNQKKLLWITQLVTAVLKSQSKTK